MYDQINQAIGYLHGLWRYRWSAVLISWLVFIAGCLVVYALPDKYESKATVNIDTATIMRPLLQGLAVDMDHGAQLGLMAQVLLNRENLLKVIHETGMDHDIEGPEELERQVRQLAKSIIISSRSQNTQSREPFAATYQIGYKSNSAEHAYRVVAEVINTMRENYQATGDSGSVMAQSFLDKQIKEYEAKLVKDERRLAEFKKKNIGFMPGERGGYYERLRASQLEIDNTRSRLREAKQRSGELRTQLSRVSPTLSGGSSASVSSLARYREQLAELLTRFTDNHPDVQALRSKIANLEEGDTPYQDASGTIYNPVYQELKVQESATRVEIGRLQIQLAEQRKKLDEFEQSIDIIPQVEADLAKLNRDYEITRERYLSLVERRESAALAQKVEQSSSTIAFRMIEHPVVPVFPSGPNRHLLLAGVIMAALAAGAGWSLLQFLLYPGFVDSKQVKDLLGLPVLGSVTFHYGAEQVRDRKYQLANFLLAMALLLITCGAAIMFAKQGSEFISAFFM